MKIHLRVVADSYRPWMVFKKSDKHRCTGIQCELTQYLSCALNFSYEFIKEKFGTTYKLTNGSWSGAFGKILSGQADISGAPVAITSEPFVKNIVDHTLPYYYEDPVIMTRLDDTWRAAGIDPGRILDQSSWKILITLFICLIIIVVLLDQEFLVKQERFFKRLSTVTFQLLGTFLQIDIQIRKTFMVKMSSLFLLAFWLVSTFQLSTIISGEITVRFSLKIPNQQIETLEELVDTKMSLLIMSSFKATNRIQNKNTLDRILKKVELEGTSFSIGRIFNELTWIKETAEGRAAMFLAAVPLKKIVKIHSKHLKPNIKFRFLRERYRNPYLIGLALSLRLPKHFRNRVNQKLLDYVSTGIIDHQVQLTLQGSQPFFDFIKESPKVAYKKIFLDNLFGFMRLNLICSTTCIIILVLEIFVYLFLS